MNPAFNRTLSLLVEIKSNIPGKGGEPKRKKVDLGPLGKAKPSWTGSTDPKPSSNDGPTVSRNNPETLEFLKPRPGEKSKPKKGFTDRLLDVLKRGAKKVKGFFKRKDEASKVVNYLPHVRRVVDTYKKDKRLRSRHSIAGLMHRRNL